MLCERNWKNCIGAIQILGENESPSDSATIDALQLTEHEIAQRLRNCPLPGIAEYKYEDDDFRISLAGVQSSEAKEVIGLLLQSVHIGL